MVVENLVYPLLEASPFFILSELLSEDQEKTTFFELGEAPNYRI
jgi:hypothetical protein